MSLSKLRTAAALTAVIASSAHAWAQGEGQVDRFFSDKLDQAEAEGEKPTETLVQGSLTSTTFAYREFGGDPEEAGQLQTAGLISNYSPAMRLFTDLRAQLDARHISGGTWDMRMDARLRMNLPCTFQTVDNGGNAQLYGNGCRTQSGTFGGNEYDAREFYVRRAGQGSDLYIGRQFVHELAATRVDGIKLTYHKSDNWDYLGFGGLHPARGSRSVITDYPTAVLAGGLEGGRVLPIAAGLGAAYRYRSIYGSLGGVGILPMAEDRYNVGQNEPPRIFVTESGYWQSSPKLDVYHFVVVDAESAAGPGLTNLSLGLNIKPVPTMRLTAAVNHVDTETLNATAQNYLADPEIVATAQPRNDVEVSRISAQSARLGVSVALAEQRFEVSTSGQVRQRPEIQLKQADDPNNYILIPAARNAEVTLQAVDRRSLLGLRIGLSLSRIMGIGDQVYGRSSAWVARVEGSRDFHQGKGQVEANVSFVSGEDEDRELACDGAQVLVENCFGTSLVQTLSLGSSLFYRFKTDWFVIASASAGRQGFSNYYNLTLYQQPPNWLVSGLARLAYRF